MIPSNVGLTPLEVASGYVMGQVPGRLPEVPSSLHPVAALEDAVLGPLQQPPCLVTFSGGRDSSTVLAVAARVARREGLTPPVPVTLCFPRLPGTDEHEWQEALIRELDLPDWSRLEFHDELDMVGPVAQRVLRRHGVPYPNNVHAQVPMLEQARGGTLLTGFDGDELYGHWRWARTASVLSRQASPEPRDLARALLAMAPPAVRRWSRRVTTSPMSWLTADAHAELLRAYAAHFAAEPATWGRRVAWYAQRRDLDVMRRMLDVLAADAGARVVSPQLDPRFLAAVARIGGRAGFPDRTTAMRTMYTDLLPDRVLARSTKGLFDEAYWGPHSRDFATRWTGAGLPADVVDAEALQQEWRNPEPDPRADLLIQAAWLASVGESVEDRDGAFQGRAVPGPT